MEISKFLQTLQPDSLKMESWVQNVNYDDQHQASKLDLSDVTENDTYCTACKIKLNEELSKVHYTLDWHRYNVQRGLIDEDPIAEEVFMKSLDDLSSVSGSDSGDSDEESSLVENTEKRIRKMIEKVELTKADVENASCSVVKRFNKPKVYFSNEEEGDRIYGIYKCLLSQKKEFSEKGIRDETIFQISKQFRNQELFEKIKGDVNEACLATLKDMKPSPFTCAVIMLGGGHFAAAIFSDGIPVEHKTFHSYTVRAKQGGSQSSRDSKSGGSHPKSAGASLRRYNEAAFAQHITELMMDWREKLAACNLILFRAVSSNNALLFGGKNPILNKLDERLRSIPIPTRRATFAEVKRVFKELTTVEVLDRKEVEDMIEIELMMKKEIKQKITPSLAESSSPIQQSLPLLEDPIDIDYIPSPKKKPIKPKKKSPQTLIKEMEEIELFDNESKIIDKIVTALKENNDDDFNEYFVQLDSAVVDLQVDGEQITKENVLSRRRGDEGLTLLHYAAIYGRRQPLWYLLESGSDPAILDYRGRTAYSVSADKETRNTFRRFYGVHPEKYDYAKALIPSPLTDEAEQAKAAKLAEKRRLQKIARKEKEMKKKLEERKIKDAEKEAEEEEKRRFLTLSDREKRALAAERRLLAQASSTGSPVPITVRCFLCGADITGKVPFEYSSYLFCTTACLAAHRRKLQAVKT